MGFLLVTDNRDFFQKFSDFIMASYMTFIVDIQIPVLMGNSEWHWPSGWDSPGTAASWGSLDVVRWQTWSLNTDLEFRLYDIQQLREVFVFKHKDAVYYPLFDSGVLKLKKFENIYSFDPSFASHFCRAPTRSTAGYSLLSKIYEKGGRCKATPRTKTIGPKYSMKNTPR
jgi:hypothetical protein